MTEENDNTKTTAPTLYDEVDRSDKRKKQSYWVGARCKRFQGPARFHSRRARRMCNRFVDGTAHRVQVEEFEYFRKQWICWAYEYCVNGYLVFLDSDYGVSAMAIREIFITQEKLVESQFKHSIHEATVLKKFVSGKVDRTGVILGYRKMALFDAGRVTKSVFLGFDIVELDCDGKLFVSKKAPEAMSQLDFR